jgi:sugar/nucleoside kinase (ribokinase family)
MSATVTVIGCVQADVLLSPLTELPPAGHAILVEQMGVRVGGAGANTALACVEAGADVRLVGCIGDDQVGRWMRDELAPFGLDRDLIVIAGEPSGLTVALESPDRDRTFLTYLGVNADWGPESIQPDALVCESLVVCDYFVMPRLQRDAARGLLAQARAHGARTFFDTSWDPGGFAEPATAGVRALLREVDVFLPNEAEARALTGIAGGVAEAARALQQVSGGWVVVKLGADGCLAAGPGDVELTASAPAVTVVDTIGAGDAFNAGIVHALSGGADWQDALQWAAGFASEIIARPSHERYRVAATRPVPAVPPQTTPVPVQPILAGQVAVPPAHSPRS